MKKIIPILLAAVMLASLALPLGSAAMAQTQYDWIKVKLSTQNAAVLQIPVSGSYFIQENGKSFSGGTLTISQTALGQVEVSHSTGGLLFTGTSCQIMREDVSASAGYLQIETVHGKRKYLGHFNVKATGAGLQIVNVVPLAQYLYGVVGYEMSDAFPLEALKAQAVVSKCYVLSGLSTSGEYFIGDTSSDQVYKGYDSSASNVIKAVDSTLNVVLKSGSSILKTYYAASNGGETNLVSYAWSSSANNSGYGISTDDYDFNNQSSLKETVYFPYGGGTLGSALRTYLINAASAASGTSVSSIVAVNSVQAHTPKYAGVARNLTKARISLTVAVPDGSSASPGTGIGTGTGSGGTGLGTGFGTGLSGIGFGSGLGLDGIGFGLGTGLSGLGGSSSGTGSTGSGTPTPTINVSNVKIVSQDAGKMTLEFDFLLTDLLNCGVVSSSSLRIFWGEKASGGYNIYHVRYGHGVGMSQRGAQQRAAGGQGYKDILKFYYPTATLSTFDVSAPQNPEKPAVALAAIAYGELTKDKVNLRKSASTESTSLTKLKKGTELTVYQELTGWYYVKAGSKIGYVSSDFVKITSRVDTTPTQPDTGSSGTPTIPGGLGTGLINTGGSGSSGGSSGTGTGGIGTGLGGGTSTTTQRTGVITRNGVNFRNIPSTSGSVVICQLSAGTTVKIINNVIGWYYVEYNGMQGYVSEQYVSVS
ncbi:MAG: SpoIID/LytB domain-containing protein [Bacillota bacterium]